MKGLKFSNIPESCLLDEEIIIQLELYNFEKNIPVYGEPIQFDLKLFSINLNDTKIYHNDKLRINLNKKIIPASTHLTFSVIIQTYSFENENKPFFLEAVAPQSNSLIQPAISNPIFVWRYSLQAEDIESPWYRDDGGRYKGIKLDISLISTFNNIVSIKHPIPLELSVLYSDGSVPSTNNIVKLLKPESKQINLNGKAHIVFRFEEISMHHKKKLFILKISPTQDSIYFHQIRPLESNPVEVMTKRKRNNQEHQNEAPLPPPPLPTSHALPPPVLESVPTLSDEMSFSLDATLPISNNNNNTTTTITTTTTTVPGLAYQTDCRRIQHSEIGDLNQNNIITSQQLIESKLNYLEGLIHQCLQELIDLKRINSNLSPLSSSLPQNNSFSPINTSHQTEPPQLTLVSSWEYFDSSIHPNGC